MVILRKYERNQIHFEFCFRSIVIITITIICIQAVTGRGG